MFLRFGMALSIVAILGSVSALAAPVIVEFDPQGSNRTHVTRNSIDNKGNIAGSYCCDRNFGTDIGFIRTPKGKYTNVGPSGYDVADVVLGKGKLVAGSTDEAVAFIDDSKGDVITFKPPGESDGMGTDPTEIDADGTAIGYFGATDGLWHGFIRNADGSFTTFDAPKAGTDGGSETAGTFVSAVNDGGEIVGWSVDDSGQSHAYLRMPNGKFKLLRLPQQRQSGGSYAYCINKKGTIGGYFYDVNNAIHGYLRDHKGNVTLVDIKDANFVQVSGVNSNGDATGIYHGADGIRHGFVRSASGDVEKFNAPDAGDGGTYAQSINDSGVVAGEYSDIHGMSHGFVRTP